MTPSEIHNRLAPELLKRLVTEAGNEVDAFIVVESFLLGVMLYYRPKPSHAAEFLDSITERVIGRMQP
jgi:hypothetical protein